jgi:uncharacterized membrane protein
LLFTVLTIFSHYGTATIALAIVAVYVVGTKITSRQWFKIGIAVCGILVVVISVWYIYIPKTYGDSNLLMALVHNEPGAFNAGMSPEVQGIIPSDPKDWVDVGKRDTIVQTAFGLNFSEIEMPTKIELVVNWAVVLVMSLGLFLIVRLRMFDTRLRILMLASYAAVISVIAVPWLSVNYGVTRTLFTSSIVLAIGFPVGVSWIAGKLRCSRMVLAMAVLGLYAASTSGLVYLPFGESKTFPVATVNPEVIEYIEAQE